MKNRPAVPFGVLFGLSALTLFVVLATAAIRAVSLHDDIYKRALVKVESALVAADPATKMYLVKHFDDCLHKESPLFWNFKSIGEEVLDRWSDKALGACATAHVLAAVGYEDARVRYTLLTHHGLLEPDETQKIINPYSSQISR